MALFGKSKEEPVREEIKPAGSHAAETLDQVTGLPNKEGMERHYKSLQGGAGYAYMVICMERFLKIHEVFGFEAGMANVVSVADVLRSDLGEGEFLCREMLDRFGLLIRLKSENELADRLKGLLEKLHNIEITDGDVRYAYPRWFTCGVYELHDEGEPLEEVRDMAELALKESRQKKSPYVIYTKAMQEERREMKQLLADSAEAMQKGEFVPFFHPKYDLNTKRIVGADVLARWQHPEKGLILPNVFLPMLEQNGKIMDLDMYMLEQACELINKWTENESMPVPLSINISTLNLFKRDFTERIIEIVRKHNTPSCLIELEINESAAVDNSHYLLKHMKILSEEGFQISIDNFGSGYTSLKLLKDMPVNLIKLDRGFLKNEQLDRNVIVLKNMIQMAHELGMLIIAEGIETEKHVEILKNVHCNYGMGFLFTKPMPLYAFESLTL